MSNLAGGYQINLLRNKAYKTINLSKQLRNIKHLEQSRTGTNKTVTEPFYWRKGAFICIAFCRVAKKCFQIQKEKKNSGVTLTDLSDLISSPE